jgi:hypothetical protein
MMDATQVDIRLAVGVPTGEQPIKVVCPMHYERIGSHDNTGSLCVYRANIHCMGCGWHVSRRYASLAYLLGMWDGKGNENGQRVSSAVKAIKDKGLDRFLGVEQRGHSLAPPPLDPYMADSFHQYLLCRTDKVDELRTERGLTLATLQDYRIGYTGTHFSIPVLDGADRVHTLRYRGDKHCTDTHAEGYSKYQGVRGYNEPVLFPMQSVRGLSHVEELWITEGEFDALASTQEGGLSLTVTNGAQAVAGIAELISSVLPSLLIGRWVIAVDQDKAGEACAEKLMAVLFDRGQAVVRAVWDSCCKDLSDFYSRGGDRRDIRYAS